MTILSNIIIWAGIIFIIYWAVKKHKAKKNGQKYEKQYYPIIIGLVLLIVGSIMNPIKSTKTTAETDVSKVSSSVIKKSSSSSHKNVAKKASSKAVTSKSSSSKSSSTLDYSKVEYGMTMDEVINAIGTQPTDKNDYTLYFGDEEFDFNDNKLIGASVKSVQDKIDAKFKADQKSERKQSKGQKEQKFTEAINNKIDELNQATQDSSGVDVIQGIDNPYGNTYKIQLDNFVLSGNDRQIKSVINSINSQFIEIFEDNGKQSPVMRYEVDGTEIAKNKVLDPSEIKLEN